MHRENRFVVLIHPFFDLKRVLDYSQRIDFPSSSAQFSVFLDSLKKKHENLRWTRTMKKNYLWITLWVLFFFSCWVLRLIQKLASTRFESFVSFFHFRGVWWIFIASFTRHGAKSDLIDDFSALFSSPPRFVVNQLFQWFKQHCDRLKTIKMFRDLLMDRWNFDRNFQSRKLHIDFFPNDCYETTLN